MFKQSGSTPIDRKFAKTHEWVKIENATAIVGISDHAQHSLGDITFIELPTVGKSVKQGESCSVIESVKAASDIYAPISGEIAVVNKHLETHPEVINSDPYGEAWLFKMKNIKAEESVGLMDSKTYDDFVESEK